MERCSPSLTMREMQIKTTMRNHLTLVRTAAIKKSTTINAGEGVQNREPSCAVGGNANCGEQCGDSLKIWEQNCHTTQQSHCWT